MPGVHRKYGHPAFFLTFMPPNDIIISRYNDIIRGGVKRVSKNAEKLSERDKQVQVRLPAALHKELRLRLLEDNSSLANFFNEAAEAYLKCPEGYNKAIKTIRRRKNNG